MIINTSQVVMNGCNKMMNWPKNIGPDFKGCLIVFFCFFYNLSLDNKKRRETDNKEKCLRFQHLCDDPFGSPSIY